MYHFRNSIIHQDKIVADKVSFFADYFEFTSADLGRVGIPELENHKSLLEKILLQLENYTRHSKKYINHYFKNVYLDSNDPLIKEFYAEDWKLIDKLKQSFSKQQDINKLVEEIKKFIEKLDSTLFQNALNTIISAIQCKHPIEEHNHIGIFTYYTPILISEFVFAGFDQKGVHELFRKIFEKEIKVDNGKVQTEAPLPSELIELKDDSIKFYEAASIYLQNRDLKQQFEGLYFLFKQSIRERTVIFQLNNIQAYDPMTWEYDKVIFSNQFKNQYVRNETHKEFYAFFNKKEQVLAKVSVTKGDERTTIKEAVRRAQSSLNYLNATIGANAQIISGDYIICDNDNCFRHSTLPKTVHANITKVFENGNIRNSLNEINSKFVNRVLSSEQIYFKALSSIYPEEKLVNLWRYLESFYYQIGYKAEDLKKSVSKVLSQTSPLSFAFNSLNLAHKVFDHPYFGLDAKRFNTTREELWTLLHSDLIINSDFKRMAELINHPFVTSQLKWHIDTTDSDKITIGYNFYLTHLTEVYEQRNLIEHCGTFSEKALQKIMLTFPKAVTEFRRLVIQKAKEGRIKNFNEFI